MTSKGNLATLYVHFELNSICSQGPPDRRSRKKKGRPSVKMPFFRFVKMEFLCLHKETFQTFKAWYRCLSDTQNEDVPYIFYWSKSGHSCSVSSPERTSQAGPRSSITQSWQTRVQRWQSDDNNNNNKKTPPAQPGVGDNLNNIITWGSHLIGFHCIFHKWNLGTAENT